MVTTRIRHRARATQGESTSVPFTALPIVQSVALETLPHASSPQCSRLPVWLSPRRPCSTAQRAAELGKRGFAAESAVAQICREGGARVSTNVMLRDLDISPPHSSDCVWKWWPKGCVCSACQLALDATVVSTLHEHTGGRRTWSTTCGHCW